MIHYKMFNYSKCTADDIYCVDTETSSYWVNPETGVAHGYDEKLSNDYYNHASQGAVVYIWMVGVNDVVIYGRELDELPVCLHMIRDAIGSSELAPIMWVHNLAYDFQFLRNVFDISCMFARTIRKPMKYMSAGFEWRCTYMLTHLSLEKWGETVGVYEKQIGKLDYHILRSPLSELTEDNLLYCECDILVMYAGLCVYRNKYGSLHKIPLTQTGEVRGEVKKMYAKDNGYRQKITELQPKTVSEYRRLRSCFAGGDTHANARNSGKIHKNVASYDKTSDYPYQMCAMKYPWTPFRRCSKDLSCLDPERYAYIIMLRLYRVRSVKSCRYIARSRCVAVSGGTYDNGRVINADTITISVTEQDWWIICRTYDFDCEIVAIYRSYKKYLDKKYILYILELYGNKTSLKGVKGMEELYAKSKQYINSLYGMMVTDILMSNVLFECNEWSVEDQTADSVQEILDEIQEKWWKNTLAYQHGVWVTAYARRELWEVILHVDNDVVYYDTDSCKFLHYEKYTDYFRECDAVMDQRLHAMCDVYDIDFELTRPKKKNGVPAPLGHWDFEGVYRRFITTGAKKYAYDFGSEIHITVAGVPKKAACCVRSLKQFREGMVFDRDKCGKKLLTYLDGCNSLVTLPDGYAVHHGYAVNMRNNGYTLSMTAEYETLIMMIDFEKGILHKERLKQNIGAM